MSASLTAPPTLAELRQRLRLVTPRARIGSAEPPASLPLPPAQVASRDWGLPVAAAAQSDTSAPAAANDLLAMLWRPGTLCEWLVDEPGAGAITLAWCAWRQAQLCRQGVAAAVPEPQATPVAPATSREGWYGHRSLARHGYWAFLDPTGERSPAALAGWGLNLDRAVLIHPAAASASSSKSHADAPRELWWALEQALRSSCLAVTCAWVDHVPQQALRRWQLAAEAGGGTGLLIRPGTVRREPSWADLRLRITPVAAAQALPQTGDHQPDGHGGDRHRRRFRMEVLYQRGGLGEHIHFWELEHATGLVRVVSPLADPAVARGSSSSSSTTAGVVCRGRPALAGHRL